jgi:hypothetical protein
MSVAEKSAYVAEHGSAAFLALPDGQGRRIKLRTDGRP